MQNVSDLVSVVEMRRQIGVSHGKAYNMLRTGEIESLKVGKLRRIPQSAIDAYVSNNKSAGWSANA